MPLRVRPLSTAVNPPTKLEQHRFHYLDALRGIAAIFVILRHAPKLFIAGLVSHSSYLAVDFFFCLSGFVIAFAYEGRLQQSLGVKNFMVARIIRLYPIAALGTIIGAIEMVSRPHPQLGFLVMGIAFPLNLLGLPCPRYDLFPFDTVMWTLFFELLANLVYASLIRAKLAKNWLFASFAIISLGVAVFERRKHVSLDLGFDASDWPTGLARVGMGFFLGILLYRFHKHSNQSKAYDTKALLAGGVLTAVFVGLLCNPIQFMRSSYMEIITAAVLMPLIVYLGARIAVPARWMAVCVLLGNISYPLYILHSPLWWPLFGKSSLQFARQHTHILNPLMLAYAACMIALSWLAAEFYDEPVRRRLFTLHKALERSSFSDHKSKGCAVQPGEQANA